MRSNCNWRKGPHTHHKTFSMGLRSCEQHNTAMEISYAYCRGVAPHRQIATGMGRQLHLAVQSGFVDTVRVPLANSASISAQDLKGSSALQLATANGDQGIIHLLRDKIPTC